jgi:hypothetical protein
MDENRKKIPANHRGLFHIGGLGGLNMASNANGAASHGGVVVAMNRRSDTNTAGGSAVKMVL